MLVQCKDNSGFEDQLTVNEKYSADLRNNSVCLLNDKGHVKWYGINKFENITNMLAFEDGKNTNKS